MQASKHKQAQASTSTCISTLMQAPPMRAAHLSLLPGLGGDRLRLRPLPLPPSRSRSRSLRRSRSRSRSLPRSER
jgi:hypothetical protein